MNRIKEIKTKHGTLNLPAFLPDATYGSVKSISFDDLETTGTPGIVTTTLHLEQKLGSDYMEKFGGLHKFFDWDKPILTDSGGFQVFSLIHASKDLKENKIRDEGCFFKDPKNGLIFKLTPENSQEIQHKLDSDIRVVLDEPTYENVSDDILKKSVERTTAWAKRSKKKFLELNDLTEAQFNQPEKYPRPLLTAVIQGGGNKDLRKKSFYELAEIGFDGYNWGGWTFDENGELSVEIGQLMADLIPKDKFAYAMGVGTPDNIKKCYEMGWNLFDCVLPTRNARHGFLYVTKGEGDKDFENYSVMHIKRKEYQYDERLIDPNMDYPEEQKVSRAYLRHLIRTNESAGHRYATLHNLRFYKDFMEKLKD